MERYFRTEENQLVNIIEHCLEQVKIHPNLQIYVSTDSQNYGGKSVFVTAVVFRYGLRGAHYVYLKQRLPRISNVFNRLWKEGEFTIECADMITKEIPIKIEAIEFDYNNKKVTKSTNLVSSMKGWAESLGYSVRVKPDEMIAAKAADHLCRL